MANLSRATQTQIKKYNAKINKSAGKVPTRLAIKKGAVNKILNKYNYSDNVVKHLNVARKHLGEANFYIYLCKALFTSGAMSKDKALNTIFYASEVNQFYHYFETKFASIDNIYYSDFNNQLFDNVRMEAFKNDERSMQKIAKSVQSKNSSELNAVLDRFGKLGI